MPTLVFLVFYRLKRLSEEEEKKARREWEAILDKWPSKIRLMGVFDHAWGTRWNGFIMLECEDMREYISFWKWFRDEVRWYMPETETIIGVRR